MKWCEAKKKLPPENKYVLIYVPSRPWIDSTDSEGVFYRVAKLKKGISQEQRDNLPKDSERKKIIMSEDQHGNNLLPYRWYEFGSESHFGQEVTRWAFIEPDSKFEELK